MGTASAMTNGGAQLLTSKAKDSQLKSLDLSCESSVSVQEDIRPDFWKVLESKSDVEIDLAVGAAVAAAAAAEGAKATAR